MEAAVVTISFLCGMALGALIGAFVVENGGVYCPEATAAIRTYQDMPSGVSTDELREKIDTLALECVKARVDKP
jgi:hypothetical protein